VPRAKCPYATLYFGFCDHHVFLRPDVDTVSANRRVEVKSLSGSRQTAPNSCLRYNAKLRKVKASVVFNSFNSARNPGCETAQVATTFLPENASGESRLTHPAFS
jgi:hypothetical protein